MSRKRYILMLVLVVIAGLVGGGLANLLFMGEPVWAQKTSVKKPKKEVPQQSSLNLQNGIVSMLDSKLSVIDSKVSLIQDDISSLKSGVSGIESDISSIKSDVLSIKLDVSSIKSDVLSIKPLAGSNQLPK